MLRVREIAAETTALREALEAANLPTADLLALFADIVPLDIISQWSALGFNVMEPENHVQLEKIVRVLLEEYAAREVPGIGDVPKGGAEAPTAGPTSSGDVGTYSLPTSTGSTASESQPIYEH